MEAPDNLGFARYGFLGMTIKAENDAKVHGRIASSRRISGDANCNPNSTPVIGEPKSAPKAADAPHMR